MKKIIIAFGLMIAVLGGEAKTFTASYTGVFLFEISNTSGSAAYLEQGGKHIYEQVNSGYASALMTQGETVTIGPDVETVTFKLIDSVKAKGELIADFGELYGEVAQIADATLPYEYGGYKFWAGLCATWGGYIHNYSRTPCTDKHTAVANKIIGFGTSNIPFMDVNITDESCFLEPVGDYHSCVQPNQFSTHPNSDGDGTWFKSTVKSDGNYQLVAVVRDIAMQTWQNNQGTGVFAHLFSEETEGYGFACTSGYAGLESENNYDGAVILRADSVALKAGTMIGIAIRPNGVYYSDSTAFSFYLFKDESPREMKYVNIDFDGKQADDDEPITYSGKAKFAEAGDVWNSIYMSDDTVQTVIASELKDSEGKKTHTTIQVSSTNGNNLNFDRGSTDSNDLMDDYIFCFSTKYKVEISGLVPNENYDLWAYCGNGKTYFPDYTTFEFNQMQNFSASNAGATATSTFGWQKDTIRIAGLTADADGKIEGYMGTPSGAPMIVNGFQLVSHQFRYNSGFIINIR